MATRKLGDLNLSQTVLFVCDIQERFRKAIQYFEQMAEIANRLTEAARILDVPVVVTEQYPKGLGSTVAEVKIDHACGVFAKTKFSMLIPDVEEKMTQLCHGEIKHVILCGLETHVCIQQTVIDLLKRDIEVHVVADAVSSRSQTDRILALERFRHMGCTVTTSEAVLLQMVGDKDHPRFKDVQALIKTSAPDTGLVPHRL